MHLSMFLQCEYNTALTDHEAFEDALALADAAEKGGLDEVWVAELHFASPDGFASGRVPSVASAPLVLATALACRTSHLRIGTGVSLLPLMHPVQLAEEVTTLDHLSGGRLDLGVGRSAFPIAYTGYGIPYEESRERFDECLDILRRAFTQERFSYRGKYWSFDNVTLIPKPYQRPHPPIRVAASTRETFPRMGREGYPIFMLLGSTDAGTLAENSAAYHEAWQNAGHPGSGDVMLRLPVYVAETERQAYEEPRASTEPHYRRLAERIARSTSAPGVPQERAVRAERLAGASYDEMLRDRLAYGTPDAVAERLLALRGQMGLSGFMIEPNAGGVIPKDLVMNSVRLFAEKVAPRLRAA